MKTALLSLVMVLTSVQAFAGVNANSSWEKIFAAHVRLDAPVVAFGSRFFQVTDLCYVEANDQLRTAEAVMTYTLGRDPQATGIKEFLFKDMNYMATQAVGYNSTTNSVDYVQVPARHELSYTVGVYEANNANGSVAFTKIYDIPNCK